MKAKFYTATGRMVWECTINAQFEYTNASRAMRKGAIKGLLFDAGGNLLETSHYLTPQKVGRPSKQRGRVAHG
jgi:hypothetical protein